jgi:uncharacterized membrane protein HdeD (DUF308 family)
MSTASASAAAPTRLSAALSDAMSSALAKNWWAVALRGVAAVLFGLFALFLTGPTMLSLVLVFGAYSLVDGVFAIVSAVRAARRRERWILLVLSGLVSLVAAAAAILWPSITVVAFVLVVAAWSMLSGFLSLAAALRLNKAHGRIWMAIGGIASIIFGVLLVIAPMIGAVVLTWWLGAYALVFGVTLLVLAFKLRRRREDIPAGAIA